MGLSTIRADGEAGVHPLSIPGFNLSRLKVLRSLEVGTWITDLIPASHHAIVMEVFSTITSPVFSELVVIVQANGMACLPLGLPLFETLHMMHKVRPFKLVFLLTDLDLFQEETRRKSAGTSDSVTVRGLLDFLVSPPTTRIPHIHHGATSNVAE